MLKPSCVAVFLTVLALVVSRYSATLYEHFQGTNKGE
jgi:hypothetical protein